MNTSITFEEYWGTVMQILDIISIFIDIAFWICAFVAFSYQHKRIKLLRSTFISLPVKLVSMSGTLPVKSTKDLDLALCSTTLYLISGTKTIALFPLEKCRGAQLSILNISGKSETHLIISYESQGGIEMVELNVSDNAVANAEAFVRVFNTFLDPYPKDLLA